MPSLKPENDKNCLIVYKLFSNLVL